MARNEEVFNYIVVYLITLIVYPFAGDLDYVLGVNKHNIPIIYWLYMSSCIVLISIFVQ